MGVDRDGPCDLSKAKCRMGKMPQKMLARFEAQGIKAFDGEKELDFSGGDEDNKGKDAFGLLCSEISFRQVF